MEKFNKKRLKNIQNIFEERTGTKVTKEKSYVNYRMKQLVLTAGVIICFFTLCAFAYSKFSGLEGDEVGFNSKYIGDGVFEINITNKSDRDLALEEKIKLMRWSTGEEIMGDKDKIVFSNMTIEAQSQKTITIDLSSAYDMEILKKPLPSGDSYYIILTNNNFTFGQDWMCTVYFDESAPYFPNEKAKENEVKEAAEKIVYSAVLTYDEWVWMTESEDISVAYGMQSNGTFSDHINIAGELKDDVYAVAEGTVLDTGFDNSLGNYIVLDLGNDIMVKYGHLKKVSVKVGESVKAGEKIATLGQSGMATGANLYFALYVGGEATNPLAE